MIEFILLLMIIGCYYDMHHTRKRIKYLIGEDTKMNRVIVNQESQLELISKTADTIGLNNVWIQKENEKIWDNLNEFKQKQYYTHTTHFMGRIEKMEEHLKELIKEHGAK